LSLSFFTVLIKITLMHIYGLSHVVPNSESRRARINLLTFIESTDDNYPRLGVFTAVIKKKFKNVG
jgi:hypothetical protein